MPHDRHLNRTGVAAHSPLVGALFLALLLSPAGVGAQQGSPDRIRVAVNCNGPACDQDHFQREIRFVDWVRDRADAHVYVLITERRTGAGGEQYELTFTGRGEFGGIDEELRYTSSATDTDAEAREGLTRTLKAGLFSYAARTPTLRRLEIAYDPGAELEAPAAPEDDPWNRWVFRTSLGGSVSAEDRSDHVSARASQSISRVTEGMKLALEVGGRYSESNFETSDTTTTTSIIRNYEAEFLYVASVGSHWGLGFRASAQHSTFRNFDLALRLAPAVEFNIFPYEESTRRQLRILYSAGFRRFDYDEETIFFETREMRSQQSLSISLDVTEPWGSADLALEGSHFLGDFEQNRLTGFGFLRVRLFKGFGMFIEANAARVRDQINLPRQGATEEEVLLRQRELETDFRMDASIGFDITFGSAFTDVVNPRFGG